MDVVYGVGYICWCSVVVCGCVIRYIDSSWCMLVWDRYGIVVLTVIRRKLIKWEHYCIAVYWYIACGIVYGGVDCIWYCVWCIPLVVIFLVYLIRFDIVSGLQLVRISSMVCDGACCV